MHNSILNENIDFENSVHELMDLVTEMNAIDPVRQTKENATPFHS